MSILDIFKVKKFKSEIDTLTKENEKINLEINKIKKLTEKSEVMTLIELEQEKIKKNEELDNLNNKIKNLDKIIQDKNADIQSLEESIEKLKSQMISYEDDIHFESFGLYKPKYDFANSITYKEELKKIRNRQKELIKNDGAVNYSQNWTIDGSKSKGRKFTKDNIKMILRSFNNECEAAINKVKVRNIESIEKRITKSFEQINKLNKIHHSSISTDYYDLKISELYLAYEYERKKEEEKEALREQRQKEREEKALRKEVESKKKVIDKEIKHLQNVINELEQKLENSNDTESKSIKAQIEELKGNMETFEKEKEDLDYRLVHSSAGYVYIISNIGSFGENVYKIGVTRRLDPLDRINELSSASVPFKFDIHALIFSYEAYELENELHNTFSEYRVNMVNNRKEFFKLDIEDIKKELEKYKDLTIDFNEVPDAEEYRESIKLVTNN